MFPHIAKASRCAGSRRRSGAGLNRRRGALSPSPNFTHRLHVRPAARGCRNARGGTTTASPPGGAARRGIQLIGLLPWTVLPVLYAGRRIRCSELYAGSKLMQPNCRCGRTYSAHVRCGRTDRCDPCCCSGKRRALRRRTVASGRHGAAASRSRQPPNSIHRAKQSPSGLESIDHPFTEEGRRRQSDRQTGDLPFGTRLRHPPQGPHRAALLAWWVESLRLLNARAMRLRTGKINHYILFALLFIVLVFLCSIFNIL